MNKQGFTTASLNLDCTAINHNGRTVAVVSPQGHVDWMLASPVEKGPLLKSVYTEPHLSYTLGLKFVLHFPDLCEKMTEVKAVATNNGSGALLTGRSCSADGAWEGFHEAVLSVNPVSGRYEWDVKAELERKTGRMENATEIEFNNIYPAGTGRGMLCVAGKKYSYTALVDRDGVAWRFPHQHTMHYGGKISPLRFSVGTTAGFFMEDLNPVVTVDESCCEPVWGICDMYYDMHCRARMPGGMAAGTKSHWRHRIRYLDRKEAADLLAKERYIPVTADDYRRHDGPRLMLGRNDLARAATVDDEEDACWFRPEPPVKQWDRTGGPTGAGALRIVNERSAETVWQAIPPVEVPAGHALQLTALVRTQNLRGRGMFIRIKPFRFHWRPQRHCEWMEVLESGPVSGNTDDWVRVQTPVLRVGAEQMDQLAWIEVVLDGQGEGRLADVGVSLQGVEEPIPVGPVVRV